MKKIYMRAGVVPYETITPEECLERNVIGGNSGNLLYQYSMVKTLSTKGTVVVPNQYRINLNDADRINEECEMFIIPLADAFRKDFMKELREMTELIKRLTIPCVVTGVGLRSTYEPDFSMTKTFDEDVKAFVNAVLDKSAMLGLRGEITGEYLKRLGYREEIDYTVIGCPSLYMNGDALKLKELHLNRDSKISTNSIMNPSINFASFIRRVQSDYANHYFVGQVTRELRLLYAGVPMPANPLYPCKQYEDDIYQEDRARFFVNVPKWMEFLREMDLSVGARFHGTVAGLVAGTPSIIFPGDSRTREFVAYHKMPSMPMHEVPEDLTLEELVNQVDFKSIEQVHKKNFEHFIEFLDKNGIDHIYKEQSDTDYFQERMDQITLAPALQPMLELNQENFETRVLPSYEWITNAFIQNLTNNKMLLSWLEIKNKGKSVAGYLRDRGYDKIAIYGATAVAKCLYEELVQESDITVECILDKKGGMPFIDKVVQTVKASELNDIDAVIIMPCEKASIREQFPEACNMEFFDSILNTLL